MRRKVIIPLGSVILAVVIISSVLAGMALYKKAQIKDLEAFVSDPSNIAEYQQAKTNCSARDSKAAIYSQLQKAQKNKSSFPQATASLMDEVSSSLSSATVTGCTFDASTGTMVINIETSAVDDIPSLISGLRQISSFSAIDYTGYTGESGSYNVTITCMVKSSAY